MAENGPNVALKVPEELLERGRSAGRVVSIFIRGDMDKLYDAIGRMGDVHQKPKIEKYEPFDFTRSSIAPYLDTFGQGHLNLRYDDSAQLILRQVVSDLGEAYSDTLRPEFDRTKSYSLEFISTAGSLSVYVVGAFGKFSFEGREMDDTNLTEEGVLLYEDLAQRLQPILAEVIPSR